MYIGSVRFFKHVILTTIALLILLPTVGFIYFASAYQSLKQDLAERSTSESLISESMQHEKKGTDEFAVYAADETGTSSLSAVNAPAYQSKYPNLYVDNDFKYTAGKTNTIYLTFDDGPTNLTSQVLDILKEYDVTVTFFVVYRNDAEAIALYNRIVDEGHTLAVHTATHDYKTIYQSVDAYLDDFALLANALEEYTGVKPELFRFPGGSINNYNKGIYQELIAEMLRRGYTYYDWDVSSGSSTKTANKQSIYASVMNGISGKSSPIVLLHDAGTSATVAALPEIIEALQVSGYEFAGLTKDVAPTAFNYLN